jgi:hypothetical protein
VRGLGWASARSDPRQGGGELNDSTIAELVDVIERRGETLLRC